MTEIQILAAALQAIFKASATAPYTHAQLRGESFKQAREIAAAHDADAPPTVVDGITFPPRIDPPALDHDAYMLKRFSSKVSPDGRVERRIVANLITHVLANGFTLHSVFDGDEVTAVTDVKSAMELIFNLDEASLRFHHVTMESPDDWHGVLLVLGNGIDIVSDWNYYDGDPDGFNATVNAFDAEQFT